MRPDSVKTLASVKILARTRPLAGAGRMALAGLAVLAFAVHPAAAQMSMGGGKADSPVEKQHQQLLKDRAEIDRQYRATVKRNLQGPSDAANDPWANIRNTTPAKSTR